MKTIYAKDIEQFNLEDWEDMFCSLELDYESFKKDDKVEVNRDDEYFIFDKVGVREKALPLDETICYLIDDLVRLRGLKKDIYHAPSKVFDRELDAGLEEVAETFQDVYDSAMNKVLVALLELA